MIEFYPHLRWLHIAAVVASGALFALRGVLMLARSRHVNHAALRHLSVAIDTVLLAAALVLATLLHQYPFVHGWLTVKVLLLVVYIVLGSLALKRARSYGARAWCFAAALATYAGIIAVARAHHPLGPLARWLAS